MSDVLKAEKITFAEGVFMIVGTNIGAGILSVSYAARKAGYLPLLFWLVVVGIITIGYFFGNFPWVKQHLDKIIWAMILIPGLVIVLGAVKSRMSGKASGA